MILELSRGIVVPMNIMLTTFSLLRHGHVSYTAFMPYFLLFLNSTVPSPYQYALLAGILPFGQDNLKLFDTVPQEYIWSSYAEFNSTCPSTKTPLPQPSSFLAIEVLW